MLGIQWPYIRIQAKLLPVIRQVLKLYNNINKGTFLAQLKLMDLLSLSFIL